MASIQVDLVAGWPADLDAFARGALGRSFALDESFRRTFAAHVPAWEPLALVARAGGAGAAGEGGAGGPIVGALPGYLERRLGGAWLQAMPLGAPGGPLLAPGPEGPGTPELVAALWTGLERTVREQGWLGGRVTLSGPVACDRALWPPHAVGVVRSDEVHEVDLARGADAWRASLRRSARRQLTKAARLGVVVEASTDAGDLAQVHALHLAQARGWGLRAVRPLAFYQELLAPPTAARLWVARWHGRIQCGMLGFVDPGETYLWWSGSAPESRETAAFVALLAHAIETCGSRRVSLGFSGGRKRLTDFKEQMGAAPRAVPIVELAARPRTPYGAALALARTAVARMVRTR